MGKKAITICFAGVALALCLSLAVGMLFVGPAPAGANEVLAKEPALTDRDGRANADLLSDSANWFSDHFFLRQELISVNNAIFAKVLHTSDADDVILGSDDWLYYGPTLPDYTGTESMSERELYGAARNLALMEEYCRSEGRTFRFMIAPNKNSLYPEHMPAYGAVNSEHDAQRLYAMLDAMGVPYVDLFTLFAGEDEVLYFHHDSHWNSKGAALGADAINLAFGRESSYYADAFSGREPHKGDLFEMLYPAFADAEENPVYGGELTFTFGPGGTQPDSISITTESEKPGSILVYRDSFGNVLYPYLADSFGHARFSRSTAYDLTQEGEAVLIELVERNLRYLIANVPVMPAPMREIDLPEATETLTVECSRKGLSGGMVQVQGALPFAPSDASPLYLVDERGTVYEAFSQENNGFAACLPEDVALTGVALERDGALWHYNMETIDK